MQIDILPCLILVNTHVDLKHMDLMQYGKQSLQKINTAKPNVYLSIFPYGNPSKQKLTHNKLNMNIFNLQCGQNSTSRRTFAMVSPVGMCL